ncbi:hypothetical protein GCM10009682_63600 [Luedemannella flava]|uniref:Uncharacterized protein n=1 Tax=Luedemannella flava TaxID=349316 RepID=A0ABP4Z6P4_9ACTN
MGESLTDEALWALLTDHVGDPVPPDVRAAAREAHGWRDPAAALAELIADSARDDGRPATVRGPGGARLLTFAADELTIELEVTRDDRHVSLVGQLVPPAGATVHIDHRGGSVELVADDLGRFSADGIPVGPVRLTWRAHADAVAAVHTDWVLL